ncbi:MAG: carboxymuconolactone decarboxylase family protein [Mariniblastus sp.]
MAQKLIYDFRECGFDDVDRALCEFAVSLTLNPGAMRKTHVENLQELGLTDEQITVATQVTGYFNYINRVADGLGVDLEGWMTTSIDEWIEKKPNWRA